MGSTTGSFEFLKCFWAFFCHTLYLAFRILSPSIVSRTWDWGSLLPGMPVQINQGTVLLAPVQHLWENKGTIGYYIICVFLSRSLQKSWENCLSASQQSKWQGGLWSETRQLWRWSQDDYLSARHATLEMHFTIRSLEAPRANSLDLRTAIWQPECQNEIQWLLNDTSTSCLQRRVTCCFCEKCIMS